MNLYTFTKITAAIVFLFYFGLANSSEFKYNRINPDAFTLKEEAKQKTVTQQNRERYVRLRSNGGRVIDSDRPRPACTSEKHFVEYMAYVMYGQGELPLKKYCWELQTGEALVMPEHGRYEQPRTCNEDFSVCKFQYDSLFSMKGEFYTSTYIVKPN